MGKPRIYITIASFHPLVGGAEIQARGHSAHLRRRGHEVTVVTLRHERTWPASDVLDGVPVLRVGGRPLWGRSELPRPLRKLAYLFGLLALGWTLWRHRQRYDILHVYQLTLVTLPAAVVCLLTGKSLVVVVCSTGPGIGPGTELAMQEKVTLLSGPLDPSTPWLQVDARTAMPGDLVALEQLGQPAVRCTRWLLRRIDARLIVLSSRMQTYLALHHFDLPGTLLIPTAVDTTRFAPACPIPSVDERTGVVICIAKLRYEKGIDVLLHAWRLVHEQAPHARLIIVGDGSIREQLERLTQVLGIAESVEFTGLQSDIPVQLRRGSIAVLPSRWEGLSNALLEAMACALSCVATRVSGSEDVIQHGINGWLVEPEDYRGMAQALLRLLHDPALAQQYGCAARRTIEQHYSFTQITDRYLELYQSLVGRRQAVD